MDDTARYRLSDFKPVKGFSQYLRRNSREIRGEYLSDKTMTIETLRAANLLGYNLILAGLSAICIFQGLEKLIK